MRPVGLAASYESTFFNVGKTLVFRLPAVRPKSRRCGKRPRLFVSTGRGVHRPPPTEGACRGKIRFGVSVHAASIAPCRPRLAHHLQAQVSRRANNHAARRQVVLRRDACRLTTRRGHTTVSSVFTLTKPARSTRHPTSYNRSMVTRSHARGANSNRSGPLVRRKNARPVGAPHSKLSPGGRGEPGRVDHLNELRTGAELSVAAKVRPKTKVSDVGLDHSLAFSLACLMRRGR
jgi:hypothetical protein